MVSAAEIKLVRSLEHKKFRLASGLFVVEGDKLVREALASRFAVERLYHTADFACPAASVADIRPVSGKELERLSLQPSPNKAVALVRLPDIQPDAACPAAPGDLVLCLDGIQDPGNMGTLLRVADWYGVRRVFCSPDCADCFAPKAAQASMGAVFRVEARYGDLPAAVRRLAAAGHTAYATDLAGDDIYGAPLSFPAALVLGNESRGVRPATAAECGRRILFPPYPADRRDMESLNVGVAAGVLCAEFRRRQR